MASSFIDFYIRYQDHPQFRDTQLIEDDVVRVIVQKWEMIIFTNQGDVLAVPDLGGNLVELLHETRLSAEAIENDLRTQIQKFIPEINDIEYYLVVDFFDHPEKHEEYMTIDLTLAGYEINAVIT